MDVARGADVHRDRLIPQHPLYVGRDGARGVEDGRVVESLLVGAVSLGEAVPEFVIGQQRGSAVGAVNDRHVEVRAGAK